MPFGMVQLSPDTRVDSSWEGTAGYYHTDPFIYGFSHTHLSGTGISDYGDVMFMPFYGEPHADPEHYRSAFDHATEEASPGYYAVTLADEGIDVRLTATPRVGLQEYAFPRSGWVNVVLDLSHRDELVEGWVVLEGTQALRGLRRSSGWAQDQRLFFRTEFSRPFDDAIEYRGLTGGHQIVFRFPVEAGEKLLVKTALSGTDDAGARRNFEAELPGWDFEAARRTAEDSWNRELGRVEIEGGSRAQRTNFYTALYHAMIAPNLWSDVDGRYRGHDGAIHRADHDVYTVFSLWDTFRSLHPLLTLLDPERTRDFIRTMLLIHEQGGRLPVWELAANETDTMIGFHSAPVIADAYVKGIRGFDPEAALDAMIAAAEHDGFGQPLFNRQGFLAAEDEPESVSKTLEYAYDHWTIARMAELVGRHDVAARHRRLALGYRNLLDPQGFMRARHHGGWLTPFDPFEVNNHYTEANSWQYSYFVPHDIAGWMEILGGAPALEHRLDALFNAPTGTTGRRQADITGLIGQYAHGNEPSHHIAYLYNYAGAPAKAQQRVRQILTKLYHPTPEGLPGNEDCGQMSAWFVWGAMGLYPVTPGTSSYDVSAPLFPRIVVHLDESKTFVITTRGKGPYIAGAKLNGRDHDLLTVDHAAVVRGGELTFELSETPTTRGRRETVPEVDDTGFVPAPVVAQGSRSFEREQTIRLAAFDSAHEIRYSMVGATPSAASPRYEGPLTIDRTTTLSAIAVDTDGNTSAVMRAEFVERPTDWSIALESDYAPQYAATGPYALLDGIRGVEDWRRGDWLGFSGQDVVAVIDFGEVRPVAKVFGSFLQDVRSWILFPKEVVFEASLDGKAFQEILRTRDHVLRRDEGSIIAELGGTVGSAPVEARYLRLRAVSSGPLPEWHPGAGEPSWIFVDEIWVE